MGVECQGAWDTPPDQDGASGLGSERCLAAREDPDIGSTRETHEALRKEQHVQEGTQGASQEVALGKEDAAVDGTELQDSSGNKKKSLEMKNSRCTVSKEAREVKKSCCGT